LITYFDQVANNRGIVPSTVNPEQRLTDLRGLIDDLNEQYVQAHRNLLDSNIWGDANGASVLQQLAKHDQGGSSQSKNAKA